MTMKTRLLSALVIFAVMIMESEAVEESSSGFSAEGYESSGDENYSANEGSGTSGKDVHQVIDAMRKLNKNKSDDDLSKNLKTGNVLRHIPLRTFEKLSALWISIIRRLWKVWRAKGARQVMHSIVQKLVTHTGKKVSRRVGKLLTEGAEKNAQKSALPSELNAPSQNKTAAYAPNRNENVADESVHKDDSTKTAGSKAFAVKNNGNADSGMVQFTGIQGEQADGNVNQVTQDESSGKMNGRGSTSDDETPDGITSAMNANGVATEERYSGEIKTKLQTDFGSGSRNMIPQELTPESITANIGRPMEKFLFKNTKNAKNTQHKKRYRMHKHAHKDKSRDTVKYKNVDKHLIKRGSKRDQAGRGSNRIERSSYHAPISKQLESILNAKATQDEPYSKSTSVQRKRSYPAETRRSHIEESDFNNDYDYDDSSDETSGVTNENFHSKQNTALKVAKPKRKKANKKASMRKNSSKHRVPSRLRKQGASHNSVSVGNRTMVREKERFEAPVRKFKFFGVPRNDIQSDNKTGYNQGIPILSIESNPTNPHSGNDEASNDDDDQPPSENALKPLWQQRPMEPQARLGTVGQAVASSQSGSDGTTDQAEAVPYPVFVLKPTESQSNVIVPTSMERPIGHIIPNEEPPLPMADDENSSADESPSGNATSFVPSDDDTATQQSIEGNAMMEEMKSLESRMTVVEAAVAEIIEWIRNRGEKAIQAQPAPADVNPTIPDVNEGNMNLGIPFRRPTLPIDRAPQFPVEMPPPQHPRILKQIFIPLPSPNTEAEKEIENGQPVTGLPFPLNFVVAKLLAKMLKKRDEKLAASNRRHTPLPDVNIPAIEHDINRLELELGSIPLHHAKQRRLKLHLPDTTKGPIINALVAGEPESDAQDCTSTCQNGGVCTVNGMCHCPPPFGGPSCESVKLIKLVKPTGQMIEEAPDENLLEAIGRRATHPKSKQLPQKITDHRDRRRLVQILKRILRNIATENRKSQTAQRSYLEMDSAAPYRTLLGTDGLKNQYNSVMDS